MIQTIVRGFVASPYSNTTTRSHALHSETQVLIALRFMAKSGYLSELAKIHAHQEIYYDYEPEQLAKLAQSFNGVGGFPRVVGAVDGTHIGILGPRQEEYAFVNRKGEHSINVMVTCDSDLIIRDMDVKWPGSCHDAFVLSLSTLHDKFEAGRFHGYWLLGDSGYPCKRWLLTPLLNPQTPAEHRYNASHKRTRSTVERCIGVLKSRFSVKLGVDLKLFTYRHTLTAYISYDTCNLELTIGINEWAASFNVFEEDFIKEDNVNLLKEANILNVVHMKLYLKIEKTKNILKHNTVMIASGDGTTFHTYTAST
ncbi:putative nuclease HARBI1 [Lamellibrachia satsuma]|nr:putative nuclease HARBI1 [Lamellibrachia satsuma]